MFVHVHILYDKNITLLADEVRYVYPIDLYVYPIDLGQWDKHTVLHLPAKNPNLFGLQMLDILFTREELSTSLLFPSTKREWGCSRSN